MVTRQIYQLGLTAIVVGLALASSDVRADVVKWRINVDAAKIEAAQSGRLVLLHFWTPSCGPCRKLDSDVFSQPQISQLLETHFVPVKVNAELSPALANAFNITRVPTDVVLSAQGNVVAPLSCPLNPADYGAQLVNLVQHYQQSVASGGASRQPPVQSAYAGLKVGQYRNSNSTPTPGANQPAQPGQQNQPASPATVAGPQITNNRYATTPPPAAQAPAATTPQPMANRYAVAPSVAPSGTTQQVANQQDVGPEAASPTVQQSTQTTAPSVIDNKHFAANATPQATQPNQTSVSQLPAGSLPLGFEGYCPVTLKQMHKWVMGDSRFGAVHRGRTYLFTTDQQRQQFLANPDSFSPVFSGIDAVKLLEENKTVEGSRKYGYEYRGAFYLFGSQETMERFASQPDHYAAGVRQAMTRMDASTGGTIRR